MRHARQHIWITGRTPDSRAGFNLVEILIALAIFSIGVAQVMAVFPTAVHNAAENVRSVQARTLARSALAEIEVGLRVPLLTGVIEDIPTPQPPNIVEMRDGTNSPYDNFWSGYYLTIMGRDNDGNVVTQTSRIISNDDVRFTLADAEVINPFFAPGDRLKVTSFALPATLNVPRTGTVDSVSSADPTIITAQLAVWQDAELNGGGRFFLIFTSGRAARRVFVIDDDGADQLAREITCSDADFIAVGVTGGDEFVIVGAPDSANITQPTPGFGDTNARQTFPPRRASYNGIVHTSTAANSLTVDGDPWTASQFDGYSVIIQESGLMWSGQRRVIESNDEDTLTVDAVWPGGAPLPVGTAFSIVPPGLLNVTYSYAAIISNTYHPDYPAEHIARVDILVFHGYNQALPPERNRRATAHFVHYIGRR